MRNLIHSITKWIWLWMALVLLGTAAYFLVDHEARPFGWIPVAVIAVGTLIFALVWHLAVRNRISQTIVEMGLSLDTELSDRLDAMALPYGVLNRDGKFVWTNAAFRDMLEEHGGESAKKADTIREIFPGVEFWEDKTEKESARQYVTLGDRIYATHVTRTQGRVRLSAFLLTDETEHLVTVDTLYKERGSVGLLYVDNYEELLKHTDPDQHSLLGALIAQQIQKYFQTRGGIVCKTERDRFYVFMNRESLDKCKADRFSLLEEIKQIRVSNTMLVTVSMAFGQDGAGYGDNLELAQAGMDLALGRGGDQAVVKMPADVEYYGGKAQGETTQTRVRARVKAQALREVMALHSTIFIMGHKRGDNDSFGASIGIYRAAMSLGLRAHIVIDTVSFSVRPLWERFQSAADYPRDMFLTGEAAMARFDSRSMVVVVDTNRAGMTECPGLLDKTGQLVVFDHHRQGDDFIEAHLSYVEPYASSACEMVTEVLQYFGDGVKPKPLEAEAIYSGILVDTNSFTDRTSARTFEAAAFLKRSGADLVQVKKLLREEYPEYQAKASAMQSAEIVDGKYAFAECRAEGLDSPTIIGSQVANDLLNIASVRASFVFTENEGLIYVSARSIDEVNVQLIMERLGGGGHLGAAGAQLKDMSVAQAMELLRRTIREMEEEGAI